MREHQKTIEVKSILFESNDPEVLLKGIVTKGHMKFETDIIISQSQLNIVMNLLQKQNESIEINQYLTAEKMYNNEILYCATFSEELNKCIDLLPLSTLHSFKQIRA